jgi:hypothetical protein
MHNIVKIIIVGLALCGLMFVGTVAAEVDWTDDVTDPSGDVEDTSENVVDVPGADIVSVSITEEGDDLNISMVLDGEYNTSGIYSINVEVDGGDSWSFTRMFFIGFSASDPDSNTLPVDGYYSADNKTLSWVIAKVDIPATESVEIEFASSTIVPFGGGATVMDYAGISMGGDVPAPDSMEVLMNFPKMDQLQMKVTATYKGENAKDLRTALDADSDGTVSDAEVNTFMDQMDFEDDGNASDANVTYDG